jgi:hypothetical protein
MAKYRVITIAVAVKNNRIANSGELVDDSELTANPSEMISAGSIELVIDETVVDAKEEAKKAKAEADAKAKEEAKKAKE